MHYPYLHIYPEPLSIQKRTPQQSKLSSHGYPKGMQLVSNSSFLLTSSIKDKNRNTKQKQKRCIFNIKKTNQFIFFINYDIMIHNMKSNLIIDILDIFGVGFSFSINYKKRISSIFGDVLTLLIIVITIILFFSLGEDFLKSKNPSTSTSLFQRNEFSLVNLTEDYSTIVISFTRKIQQLCLPPSVNINGEFLYYGFNHYNITFKESTNSTNTNGKGYKNLTCSKEFLAKYNFNEGNYYCLNINEQPELLGDENLKTRIIDHFYISICEDNCPYSVCSDYDLCSSFEKLDEFFLKYQSDSIFKIYYPTHFYDPNNQTILRKSFIKKHLFLLTIIYRDLIFYTLEKL